MKHKVEFKRFDFYQLNVDKKMLILYLLLHYGLRCVQCITPRTNLQSYPLQEVME